MNYTPIEVLTSPSPDYELLDSGDGEKLERFGTVILRRPDPQVLWRKHLSPEEWKRADGWFKDGAWVGRKDVPKEWEVVLDEKHFSLKLSQFKHVGIFPEQARNWEWMEEKITKRGGKTSILNLFGYTGGATLSALRAGAEVCHVDGSKTALTTARTNATLSGLAEKPVRWILDDALSFAKKEKKRGRKYSGIVLDPPSFGHGPEGEMWKIEEHFLELVDVLADLLEPDPLFVVANGYAAGYAPAAYAQALEPLTRHFAGMLEAGALGIRESGSDRILPAGITARFVGKISGV